jgi:hypothetical protein
MPHNVNTLELNKTDQKIVQAILRTIDQYKQNKISLDRLMEGLDQAYSLESIDLQWSEKFEEYWDALDQIIDDIELSCDIDKTRATPTPTQEEQEKIHTELDKIIELMKLV